MHRDPHATAVFELVAGGDFACAEGQSFTLSLAAVRLGELVAGDDRRELKTVALLATHDLSGATRIWSRVTARLRSAGSPARAT